MFLLLAMSVHSQCAVPVMSMRGKMVINHVLSASVDIRGTKVSLLRDGSVSVLFHCVIYIVSGEVNVVFMSQVVLELMEMMMRMMSMTWNMSSIMPREPALQGDNGREKIQIFLLLLDMNLNIQSLF